jgi:L-asparaginase
MPNIRIISTGGTIDSSIEYVSTEKSVFNGSNMPAIITQARLNYDVALEPLMQKDSGDVTNEDRHLMLTRCRACVENHIIITHGTDTLAETAQHLGQHGVEGKVVVLVGSFVPLSQPGSDAFFNIGYALAATQLLTPGVWVAMGGEVFAWDAVVKNKVAGRFERI